MRETASSDAPRADVADTSTPVTRVLALHRGLIAGRDDVTELTEPILGHITSPEADNVLVACTDGAFVYEPVACGDSLEMVPQQRLRRAIFKREHDVLLVAMPYPLLHLSTAVLARAVGMRVVLQPLSMNGRDYRQSSWARTRGIGLNAVRGGGLAAIAAVWRKVAHGFIVMSEHEQVDAELPRDRTFVVRWPAPRTPLAAAAIRRSERQEELTDVGVSTVAPIAFSNRFDWQRKGFDRLCNWLEHNESTLPRPAVVVAAPRPLADDASRSNDRTRSQLARLERLEQQGLIDWVTDTGPALADVINSCRGVLLLSRWDGQSRILREAAMLGVPTVSTINSHFKEVVDELNVGLIVDGDDPSAIHNAFMRCAHHKGDAERAIKHLDRQVVGPEFIAAVVAASGL